LDGNPAIRCDTQPGPSHWRAEPLLYALLLAALLAGSSLAGADERPVVLALGIAASQGGEYVDAARGVADALSAELAKSQEFDVLFFDAQSPTIKRALAEGRVEADVLAGAGSEEGMRALLAQLNARFGLDISLDLIVREPETVSVNLAITLTDMMEPEQRHFTASGSENVEVPYGESLAKAASAAGKEAGRAISREIVSAIESTAGVSGTSRGRDLAELARAKLAAGDGQGALRDLEAACQLDPKDPALRMLKAEAEDSVGDTASAVIEAKRAVHLDDANPEARLLLGRLYAKAGESDRAVTELREAIRLGLDTHEVRTALGEAYLSQGLTVQAEEHFKAAAALAPTDLDATLRLGKMYERSQPSEAESLYRAFLAQGENPQVRLRLAGVLIKRRAYDEALDQLEMAATQPDAGFSDPELYGYCAEAIDYEVNEIANQLRVAAFEYTDEKITRQELYLQSGQLLERAENVRDLAQKVVPPDASSVAHGHRRFAAELLVQAAVNFRSYIETDKAYTRDQYELLQNEAIKEIAAAKGAPQ
jgi:tetratricopeptide (TPR) repeat protein